MANRHASFRRSDWGRSARLAGPGIGILPARIALAPTMAVALFAALSFAPGLACRLQQRPQEPPMIPAGQAGASSAGSDGSSSDWIVGGVPGRVTSRIATASGATAIDRQLGSYRVSRDKARQLARRLRKADRLAYAEPDVPIERSGYPLDLFSDEQWWLNRIVSPGMSRPDGDREEPDDRPDRGVAGPAPSRPDQRQPFRREVAGPEADWHGTAVAGIIGSPGEMLGIRGVWPGARMRLFASGLTCSTASKAVIKAVNAGAAVINMSYTFPPTSASPTSRRPSTRSAGTSLRSRPPATRATRATPPSGRQPTLT